LNCLCLVRSHRYYSERVGFIDRGHLVMNASGSGSIQIGARGYYPGDPLLTKARLIGGAGTGSIDFEPSPIKSA
jgi:hypothetical protein